MKWCSGPCGRHLPLAAFRPGRATCRACVRVADRQWHARRYRRSKKYQRAVKRRAAAFHLRNRGRRLVAFAARYLRMKAAA